MTLCTECKKEYANIGVHNKMKHKPAEVVTNTDNSTTNLANSPENTSTPPVINEEGVSNETKSETKPQKSSDEDVMALLKQLVPVVNNINQRLNRIETGGSEDFKSKAKPEDIAAAGDSKKDIDHRIVKIVEETLGDDFGIKITSYPDKPGLLFTLLIPQRLSDNTPSQRPVKDPENPGQYVRNNMGEVLMEDYYPSDERSRSISSTQSYDAVKEHCERVRAHIVATYQKMNRPLPEFRLKSNV